MTVAIWHGQCIYGQPSYFVDPSGGAVLQRLDEDRMFSGAGSWTSLAGESTSFEFFSSSSS